MKILARFALAPLAFGVAWAQESALGTKPDVVSSTGSPASAGLTPLFQMAIAVGAILLFVKVWLPRIVAKLNRKLTTSPTGGLRIQESATFAGGTLYVVEVRGKTLLLGASGNGVTCLADLTTREAPNPPAFVDMLESAQAKTERPAVRPPRRAPPGANEADEERTGSLGDVAEALRRARALVS